MTLRIVVVQQQIDELRDFQVVYGDRGFFPIGANHEIGLIPRRAAEIPGARPIDLATGEQRTFDVGIDQRGKAQNGAREIGMSELCAPQARGPQIGTAQIGAREIGAAQGAHAQIRTLEISVGEIDAAQLRFDQECATQIGIHGRRAPAPCVPGGNTLFEASKMFGVGHGSGQR